MMVASILIEVTAFSRFGLFHRDDVMLPRDVLASVEYYSLIVRVTIFPIVKRRPLE